MDSSPNNEKKGEETHITSAETSENSQFKKIRQRHLIQEETRVDQGSMDSRGLMEFDIEPDRSRFTVITIFFIIAFAVNSAERIKIWFRNEVSK